MLGAIFMATDYVTSPMTPKGMLIYGFGIGFLTVLIRYFGSYPEGMSFAILIMNAVNPLLSKCCNAKRSGGCKMTKLQSNITEYVVVNCYYYGDYSTLLLGSMQRLGTYREIIKQTVDDGVKKVILG